MRIRAFSSVLTMAFAFACAAQTRDPKTYRLPPDAPPEILEWIWMESDFQPQGFKSLLDRAAHETTFGLLTGFLGAPKHEIAFRETHDQIKAAVDYAHSLGFRVAFDIDIRHARGTFQKRYPDEQQWMIRTRVFPPSGELEIPAARLFDHMTWPGGSFEVLQGRVVGVYVSQDDKLTEATSGFRIKEQSTRRVLVEPEPGWLKPGQTAVVVAAFEHRTADVYAPHLESFERELFEQYRDVKLDGLLKDEWGFPPVYDLGPMEGDFWYSQPLAQAYRKSGGGDFVRDVVLMHFGYGGSYGERVAAVNRYERLLLNRNAEIEQNFYRYVKENLGHNAFVGTHATWGKMPTGDAFKNGYDWWAAKRDFGQSDEDFPIAFRTSLAKKMGGPVWYNMYYNRDVEMYYPRMWDGVRAGGRLNYMPLWPYPLGTDVYGPVFHGVGRAESRIRLLNLISKAPIDSQVAVVFGHTAALNWVGRHFGDLGVDFADDLGAAGFRADVIPSSDIESGALKLGPSGFVEYGAQKYQALVFLNPEFEPDATFDFLRSAVRSKTPVFIRGSATMTFEGKPRNSAATFVPGAGMEATPSRVAAYIRGAYDLHPRAPHSARLTDGTCILARGEQNPSGDPIDEEFYCAPYRKVKVRATGVFAARFSAKGELEALAASDLRLVETEGFKLELPVPTDVAMWKDSQGWHGYVQNVRTIPKGLADLTADWKHLELPAAIRK